MTEDKNDQGETAVAEPVDEAVIESQGPEPELEPEVDEVVPETGSAEVVVEGDEVKTEEASEIEIVEEEAGEEVAEPSEVVVEEIPDEVAAPVQDEATTEQISETPEEPTELGSAEEVEAEPTSATAKENAEEAEPTSAEEKEEKEEAKPREREEEREEKTERELKEQPAKKESGLREKLRLLQKMAQATIALRREKKYLKIMDLFAKKTEITNDDVQWQLRVSDATATRYLSELERRGKLKQIGTTGRGVTYVRR